MRSGHDANPLASLRWGTVTSDYEYVRRPGRDLLKVFARGRDVLRNPLLNFGTAFTVEQRAALGLIGLLPPNVMTMNAQLKRVYRQFSKQTDPLSKSVYLSTMHERNEVLFYKLLTEHLEEMMPIVYTPTIGQVIQEYSHWYHRPRGVYLSIDEPEQVETALQCMGHGPEDLDLIVVTDSEGILGIGDQGVGGVAITVGKLAVYIAAAGINPHRVLPVVLDTGTDNLELLNEEGYLGVRHARVRGEKYDEFVDSFVTAAHKLYPHAMLHWEDFGADNAHRILDLYRDDYCVFNDDIQGTAAVVVAAALSAIRTSGTRLADQRIVVYGAGTAGVGIASLLVDVMVSEGMSREMAMTRFWGLGSRGLLREGGLTRDFQRPFARPANELVDWTLDAPSRFELADVVRNVQPTILIGTSGQSGAFTRGVVTEMAKHVYRPVIMPLSNPTSLCEALPSDLLEWTSGRALIATGSPFAPVHRDGTTFTIAQANNALVFPGLGLGVIACKASRVSDGMIAAASKAIAQVVTSRALGASLLPSIRELRAVSARVALAVARAAEDEGLADQPLRNPVQDVFDQMWQPVYPEIEVH